MSEWKTKQLSELICSRLSYGIVQPGQHVENGIPILRVTDVWNSFNYNSLKKVNKKISDKHTRTVLKGGELLIAVVGAPGEVKIAPIEWAGFNVARAIAVAKFDKEDVRDYTFYYLDYAKKIGIWNGVLNETVQPTLNIGDLLQAEIKFPLKETRVKISKVLSSLDDRIALNRRTNATLEAMAQALFKSWFVDFDPVIDNALASGRALPEALQVRAARRRAVIEGGEYPRLPEATQALFPDGFVWLEELETWVNEGWGGISISSLCSKVQNGSTPKRSEESYWKNGGIPWLTSGEVRTSLITKTSQFISEEGLKNSSAKLNPPNTTVVAMYGATAGEVALLGIETTTNQAVCALIPTQHARLFNYLSLSTKVKELAGKARGSAQQNISKGIIENFEIVKPSTELLEEFEAKCSKFFDLRFNNIHQSTTLSSLRDVLLPALLSGEVEV